MRLQGKTAVITGAGRGLGRAYALRFAKEGAAVAVIDLREEEAQQTAKDIAAGGGKAIALKADVTSQEAMDAAAKRVADEFGRIDVLLNNAAIYGDMNIADQSIEYFLKLLNTNVLSVVVTSRAVYPYMKANGGSIINIASTAAYPLPLPTIPEPASVPISGYAVSKAAVINLTKSMATALGGVNIRVNAIAPGWIDTGKHPAEKVAVWAESVPLRRFGTPAEVSALVAFLASDEAAFITGQVISPNGGETVVGF